MRVHGCDSGCDWHLLVLASSVPGVAEPGLLPSQAFGSKTHVNDIHDADVILMMTIQVGRMLIQSRNFFVQERLCSVQWQIESENEGHRAGHMSAHVMFSIDVVRHPPMLSIYGGMK